MIDPYLYKNSETDAWGKGRSHTHKNIGKMIVLPMFFASKEKGKPPSAQFDQFQAARWIPLVLTDYVYIVLAFRRAFR